jgi:hypothetical protein
LSSNKIGSTYAGRPPSSPPPPLPLAGSAVAADLVLKGDGDLRLSLAVAEYWIPGRRPRSVVVGEARDSLGCAARRRSSQGDAAPAVWWLRPGRLHGAAAAWWWRLSSLGGGALRQWLVRRTPEVLRGRGWWADLGGVPCRRRREGWGRVAGGTLGPLLLASQRPAVVVGLSSAAGHRRVCCLQTTRSALGVSGGNLGRHGMVAGVGARHE